MQIFLHNDVYHDHTVSIYEDMWVYYGSPTWTKFKVMIICVSWTAKHEG